MMTRSFALLAALCLLSAAPLAAAVKGEHEPIAMAVEGKRKLQMGGVPADVVSSAPSMAESAESGAPSTTLSTLTPMPSPKVVSGGTGTSMPTAEPTSGSFQVFALSMIGGAAVLYALVGFF